MAKIVKLDMYIKEGTEYKTPERVALIVRKIGTNSTTDAYLEIERKPTGVIDADVAPLHKTSSNLLGPLDLGDLYYVIPPETPFKVVGETGCVMRLIGQKIILDPGERLGSPYMDRFERQFDHYLTKLTGTLTLATDEAFKANEERDILTIKPSTVETYKIAGYAGVSVSGGTVDYGYFALVGYYNGKALDWTFINDTIKGIDVKSMPLPPSDTVEEVPFTFEDYPIEVKPDHELKLKIRNISGTDLAPASGSAWSFTLKLLAEYIRR